MRDSCLQLDYERGMTIRTRDYVRIFILAFLTLFLCILLVVSDAAGSGTYGYKQKEGAQEEKGFIARLEEDRKKCDMAIENTRTLIDRSSNRPYLPELYLRLAELYIEKSRIVHFLRKARSTETLKSLSDFESKSLKNQAIEIYQRILENFPNFGDLDKVHFFMAHEYRELGQVEKMLMQYKMIISKYKGSPYVPESYLLLGDHFFNTQDLEMAIREYEAVLDYTQSPAVAVARYKLAWCHINKREFKEAIGLFEESVTSAPSGQDPDIDTYKRVDIRLEALIDMAYCYCECYKESTPQEAIAYFQRFAWSRQVYSVVLEKLAYRYSIKNKWHHAAVIYRQLSILRHDPAKLLEYARRIFECVQAMQSFEDAEQDVAIMVKALRNQKYSIHIPEEGKKRNFSDFELYARDIITHLHQKALRKKSLTDFERVASAYGLYLDFFKNSPASDQMEENYAEALFSAKAYLEAGRQTEKLALRLPPENRQKEKQLYSAVLSYHSALKNKEALNYYQVAMARGGLKTTGKIYADTFPHSERVPDVLFNVAWISYDEGKYSEAITDFSRFVESYPKSKEAKIAIHLILDAFHLKEDYEGMVRYGKGILRNPEINDQALRAEVTKIVKASESKIISSLALNAVNDWDTGREAIFEFVERQGTSDLGEESLYTLVGLSKERGDLAALLSAGSKFMTQFPTSPKIENTLSMMIDSTIRAAQFRLLAHYLEEFAGRLPRHKNAMDFLYQAAHIRENLGQYDLANHHYESILDITKKGISGQDDIIFAMADNAVHMADCDSALKVLTTQRDLLSKMGKIKADARIANLYIQIGDLKKAREYGIKAKKAYQPDLAKKDSQINSIMARMEYNMLESSVKRYMEIRLKDNIDAGLVTEKSRLLGDIEKGCVAVMQYQSPDSALSACYRCFEINKEFARFLKESPLPPDLSPEEKVQYVKIIEQKIQGYTEKAGEYLKTCIEKAHAWEICDPRLAGYFIDPAKRTEKGSFSRSGSSLQISNQCIQDETLIELHNQLMSDPNNIRGLLNLAEAYLERGDHRLSSLIVQKALEEMHDGTKSLKARAHNILGVAYLNIGDDSLARDAFNKALTIDSQNIGARINLAGLFKYYGHKEKADLLFNNLPDNGRVEETGDFIHPLARHFYYDHIKIKT
ncbi:MAG: tetratricopeptide repeat protein [bacterium]